MSCHLSAGGGSCLDVDGCSLVEAVIAKDWGGCVSSLK